MAFTISTHDSWGVVNIGSFQSLEEARAVFRAVCEDPWYRQDGTVRGVALAEDSSTGAGAQRLDWFAFQ